MSLRCRLGFHQRTRKSDGHEVVYQAAVPWGMLYAYKCLRCGRLCKG